jgi:hypothetical protein
MLCCLVLWKGQALLALQYHEQNPRYVHTHRTVGRGTDLLMSGADGKENGEISQKT